MLKKYPMQPGVNRENTRLSAAGVWYESEKVRFRQGTPEKIGGWVRISANTFLGYCKSLWNWVTLDGRNYMGVGTNLKFYVERSGVYYDITPIRSSVVLTNPFDTTSGSAVVVVNDVNHGAFPGDFVTYSGASAVGGLTINGEYQITFVIDADSYRITASSNASSTATGGGTVTADYQLNTGTTFSVGSVGWGVGPWGVGGWGIGVASGYDIRLWSQYNFGEDLVFCPRGGPLCYWDSSAGVSTRAVLVSTMVGATEVPSEVNVVLVSDVNRFVFAFGCPDEGSTTLEPMLVRWADQESVVDWAASPTNQAGGLRFSNGSEIVTAIQARQEVLAWTNSAVYSMQYVGAPEVWTAQLVGENISIISQNGVTFANGIAWWMGNDKFYYYDGRAQTLECNLRRYVFNDINHSQFAQAFSGSNEAFQEVWWWYCSADSLTIDRYVVYNYVEKVWYYGTMDRTAWLDSKLRNYPTAATYSNNLVQHENGNDDNTSGIPAAITASITSAQFDLDEGQHFMFIWRVLPDLTFDGSNADFPSGTLYLMPAANSGSGNNSPLSTGGSSSGAVTRIVELPIETYTGQLDIRVRGRQLAMKFESTGLGIAWQLGTTRLDLRPDGRR